MTESRRHKAKAEITTASNQNGCNAEVLFHYSDAAGAVGIFFSRKMYLTRRWMHNGVEYPRGAYATDIAPWDPYTRRQLAEIFYFRANRR